MNEKKFTDDNEFNELKKLLKEIPKITAPDNFEFNLMTRIQNKNFEVKSEKKKNVFSWALTPAITFATAVLILVFVFAESNDSGENPWQTPSQLIENQLSELETNQSNSIYENNSNFLAQKDENNFSPKAENSRNKLQKQLPFDKFSSFSLDEDIKANSFNSENNGETHLANASNGNLSSFDGFFLREVEKLPKADSLNKKDSTSNNYQK